MRALARSDGGAWAGHSFSVATAPEALLSQWEVAQPVERAVFGALQLATTASSEYDTHLGAALPSQEEPWSHAICSQRVLTVIRSHC